MKLMRGSVIFTLAVLLLVGACSSPEHAVPEEGTARLEWTRRDTTSVFKHMLISRYVERLASGLPDVEQLPAHHFTTPVHAFLSFEETNDTLLVVWDSTEQVVFGTLQRGGAETAWIPFDVRPATKPVGTKSVLATADIPLQLTDTTTVVVVSLEMILNPRRSMALFSLIDFRVGSIQLGGQTYRVGLTRGPGDAAFLDRRGINVFIDLDGDGQFTMQTGVDSAGVFFITESFAATEPFVVGDVVYEVGHITPDGMELVLQPSAKSEALAIGMTMPDFTVETLDGEPMRLSDFRGRLVVINWWSITCAPCIDEMPGLNTLVAKYDPEEVVFLAIAPDTRAEVQEFLQEYTFDYPQTLADETVTTLFEGPFPQHLMIDEEGRVMYHESGGSVRQHEKLDAVITALLQ